MFPPDIQFYVDDCSRILHRVEVAVTEYSAEVCVNRNTTLGFDFWEAVLHSGLSNPPPSSTLMLFNADIVRDMKDFFYFPAFLSVIFASFALFREI